MTSGTESYLADLADDTRQMIDALRAIVRSAAPGAVETIKWNAPSFAVDGQDRITLGLDRKGAARLVLHCGAKPRAIVDLTALDHGAVAQWPSLDRGVVVFRDLEDIRQREIAVSALCSRWVAATA